MRHYLIIEASRHESSQFSASTFGVSVWNSVMEGRWMRKGRVGVDGIIVLHAGISRVGVLRISHMIDFSTFVGLVPRLTITLCKGELCG